ncbi:MAG TPA: cysteine desulfurase NifS [Treponema sp.]|nr:MAG: cysteine desulfurase NifS [Treponema sp. GWA1_62_8]HCM29024.1 cysteine desulfurase NifS [Treponema sp.]
MNESIYLDYNATTPIDPEVADAILPWITTHFGNPSSSHEYGRTAKKAVDRAREQVAFLLDCEADEIVFTSGGTESNNLAIFGSLRAAPGERKGIVTSGVEHPAVARPCDRLETEGYTVSRLPVDAGGQVNAEDGISSVSRNTALVTVMLANNETGTIQPVRDLSRIAHDAGALIHTDAAQAVGKIPVRVSDLGIDFLSIAGHKLYAPKGVGALYIRRGSKIRPFSLGAGHEFGLRPGTENVPFIVGLGTACEIAGRNMAEVSERLRSLRDMLHGLLVAEVPGIHLNGHLRERLPNTLNVSFPNALGRRILDLSPGISASTGSACHAGVDTPSDVLMAMGADAETALGAVRLSLGHGISEEQVETAAQALIQAWRKARTI